MEHFLTEDFLLNNKTAKKLYHDYAAGMPIIDYHSHLPPDEIANDRNFSNLTNIWLDGDHYKWRAMRTLGIDEEYITGDANDREKFDKWAYTVPYTVRNPLYHWSHLELKKYFGINDLINPDNAENIFNKCNEQLQKPDFSAKSLLRKMKVKVVCTTDDPTDTLSFHKQIQDQNFEIIVLPTFRPDNAFSFQNPKSYNEYLNKLEEIADTEISELDDLIAALENRIGYFHQLGCRLSDHGLESFPDRSLTKSELDMAFSLIRSGKPISKLQSGNLRSFILLQLGRMYHKNGWVQQFHLGALRDASTRMFRKFGTATGFDSIGDFQQSIHLADFLNELDKTDQLAKTILYNLNPSDNAVMATMAGNFNDGSEKGKIQFGTAWWFLDQKKGMEEQIDTLSNMGLLSCFVGMLTDSRSFLSYPRHEYFRRILCNLIGTDVENGELPNDTEWLGKIVCDVCYNNAEGYFEF